MSRIHEALKKAAEERACRAPAGSYHDFVDVTGELCPPGRADDESQTRPINAIRSANTPVSLRFEELLQRCAHPQWTPNPCVSVFENEDGNKVGAESFRTLRSRLYQIAGMRTLRRILVTSSVPAEGKTFVATNLALSIIRQPDRRVLLIDADLRASRLYLALDAPSTPGLVEYLRGAANEYDVIQSGMNENLCFIPSGNEVSNPSELLLSERMKHLLDLVTPVFDFVILDSSPAIPVHDPSLLADLCDGTLFVVRAGVTNFELAIKAAGEFEKKNLLGVVLNGAGPEGVYRGYYSSYYGHSSA